MRNKDIKENSPVLCKIVYMDEGSVADYIQIFSGGKLDVFIEEESGSGSETHAGANASMGVSAKIRTLIFGGNAELRGEAGAEVSKATNNLVKSVITNTLLTDFLALVDDDDSAVCKLDGYQLFDIEGSLSSMILLTPYLSMLRTGQAFEAGEFEIAADKLDSTLTHAKGYFEFRGEANGKSPVILRFNNEAFRNNYKPSDLLKMNLVYFGIKVGTCNESDLSIDSELRTGNATTIDEPDYPRETVVIEENFQTDAMSVYDILLAGVMSNV